MRKWIPSTLYRPLYDPITEQGNVTEEVTLCDLPVTSFLLPSVTSCYFLVGDLAIGL